MSGVDPELDLRAALNDLSRLPIDGGAPDLSRSIMGRLGYMRVGSEVARRRRLSAWAGRAGLLAVAGVALAIGWRVFEASPQVRRPAETTIPQAIRHDVEQQQQRLDSMIQTIRSIPAPKIAPREIGEGRRARPTPPEQPAPGSMNAPYSAEEQASPHESESGFSDPAPGQSPDGQEMREDVNRGLCSSVRWA